MVQEEKITAITHGLNSLIFGATATDIKVEGNVVECGLGGQHVTILVQERKGRDFLRRRFAISQDGMADAWAVKADWIFMQNTDNASEIVAVPVSMRARQFGKLRPIVTFDETDSKVYTYFIR